ncbi:hypothetical protein AB4159_21710 [Vibrio cyclitrophicus]|uniref:hypothetical protein n=1 Tax=Vibrio cyclitrophicus TaxID=47951 RepID=UPI000769C9C3|nr:hypothetical protein [Vibrio cyclitrophicus]PMJ39628.1 hypothetical protein BCU24_18890 [Vibrio cyclitrophicus]
MEQIFNNLTSLDWWFTGIFFVLVGLFFNWLFKWLPSKFKKLNRNNRAKRLKKIRHLRWSQSEINYEISKATGRFIVFCIICLSYLSWLAYKPIQNIFDLHIVAGLIFSLPIYIMEFLWLNQDAKAKDLIRLQRKLRITKPSTRCL